MKYSLLTASAALVLAAGTMFGRSERRPFFDTTRPDKFIEIGVHVGDGASTIRQNYVRAVPDVSDFILTPGNRLTFGFTAALPVRNYLAVGTGLDFAINNYYWSMTLLERNQGTLSSLYSRNHYYAIEVPAYLQWRFNVGTHVNWRVETGMYLSFGTGGDARYSETRSSTNALGQSQVSESNYKNKYYKDPEPVINTFEKNDVGLHLGTGILVHERLTVNAVMHVGFTDLARNMGVLNIHAHTLNVTFVVGYQF